MNLEEKLAIIKKLLIETSKEFGISIEKIILFGSRARGDYTEDSDWDILVVSREKLDRQTKRKFLAKVRRKIVWAIDDPIDIIIVDAEYYNRYKKVYGDITGIATLEGIIIWQTPR